MLSLSKTDSATKKLSYKQIKIYSGGVWCFEIILILLIKIIAIYTQFF